MKTVNNETKISYNNVNNKNSQTQKFYKRRKKREQIFKKDSTPIESKCFGL